MPQRSPEVSLARSQQGFMNNPGLGAAGDGGALATLVGLSVSSETTRFGVKSTLHILPDCDRKVLEMKGP